MLSTDCQPVEPLEHCWCGAPVYDESDVGLCHECHCEAAHEAMREAMRERYVTLDDESETSLQGDEDDEVPRN